MRVCIIIANYNHTQYLKRSISSARAQTYKDIEIFVVDDGSEDVEAAQKIVEEIGHEDPRVRFLSLGRNFGKWHALNEAIRLTDCDFITTLDADDMCQANRIERQLIALQNVPNALHVMTLFWPCWSEKDLVEKSNETIEGPMEVVAADEVRKRVLFGKNIPGINHFFTGDIETHGASSLFHRSVWDAGLRFNPPQKGLRVLMSEDSDFNFRMAALLGRTIILNEKLYCYSKNTGNYVEEL